MFPEDRVLVGVINRKRDFLSARDEGWYRIPKAQMPHGVYQEYIGFFLSGKPFAELSGSVAYYAKVTGTELARRVDLLPSQPNHPRADNQYYKVGLEELQQKRPPIRNESRRSIAFIHTTWDRFVRAETIADLYSEGDYFVDRIYHALRNTNVQVQRYWETEADETGYMPGAGFRVIGQNGEFKASTRVRRGFMFLDMALGEDKLLEQLREEIAKIDGPVMGPLRADGF